MTQAEPIPPNPQSPPPEQKIDRAGYWRANVLLIGVLLSIWAIVSLGCGVWFVEQLNAFYVGQLPLGFWISQQGSIYVFVLLIFVYAFSMDRLDRKYGVEERDQ